MTLSDQRPLPEPSPSPVAPPAPFDAAVHDTVAAHQAAPRSAALEHAPGPPAAWVVRMRQFLHALVLASVIGLAYAGQRAFNLSRGIGLPVAGVGLLLLAGALLCGLLIWTNPRFRRSRRGRWLDDRILRLAAKPGPVLCWLAAASLTLGATRLGQTPGRGWYAVGLWLASIVLALLATASGSPAPRAWAWLRAHRGEAALVLLCLVVALAVRTVRLATVPPTILGDEASIGLEARNLLAGTTDPSFVTGWAGLPRLTFLLMALPMQLWGQDIGGLRMHAALTDGATIVTLYLTEGCAQIRRRPPGCARLP